MRLSSSRNLLVVSSISLSAFFLWTFSWEPHATLEVPIQTFNNRKSLSLQGSQLQTEKSNEKTQTWQESTLTSEGETVNEFQGQVTKTAAETRRPEISKTDNHLNIEKEIVHARNNSNSSITGGQKRVILMSYMRAGSTFTGDLFQFSPDVTYFYEPLLYTHDTDTLQKGTPIRNRLIGQFINHPNPPETQELLEALLHCELSVHNMEFVIGLTFSQSFNDFLQCKKDPMIKDKEQCVVNLKKRCQQSRNVMAKVLRLKMWEVDELMSRDKDLRVIHLVRDPRGILLSRRVAGYFLEVGTLCNRIATDAELNMRLQAKYPGRLMTVRYEDLAMNPLVVTKRLYEFAGVDWTDVIASRVQNITSSKDATFKEHIFSTKRRNSTTTAFNWRSKLGFRSSHNAQGLCAKMMDIFGYKHFVTQEDMRDWGKRSMDDKYSDNFLKPDFSQGEIS